MDRIKQLLNKAVDAITSIKTWQLIVAFIVMLLVSSWLLRQNNLEMSRLRDEVLKVDEEGGDVNQALANLGTYIFSHMNTDMGQPIELVSSYNRAVEKAQQEATEGADGGIYDQAVASCHRRGVPLTVQAQCVQEFITANSAPGQAGTEIELPPKELYIYHFASPAWTPDLAGWSVVLTFVIFIFLVSKFVATKIVSALVDNE